MSLQNLPNSPSRWLIMVVLLTLGLCVSGCSKVGGSYQGLVRNQSYDVTADLFLNLREENGIVTGNMTIGAPLYGGGSVMGQRNGSDLQLTTHDGAGGQITWIGKVKGRQIEGYYVVTPGAMNTLIAGAEKQQGIWAVKR